MVVVPAGEYWMGSPEGEGDSDEHPEHRVVLSKGFAVGRYEVTFAQWDACRAAGGCTQNPDDEGWGRGSRPIVNVSWSDAREYVRWLTRKTGKRYRLLSEAEWEYVAHGGTETERYWGDDPADACDYANVGDETYKENSPASEVWPDDWKFHLCRDGYGQRTSPVGRFLANDFGVYDVMGNAWEWVSDCVHDSYV